MEEYVLQNETGDIGETDALKMEVKKLKDENQRLAEERLVQAHFQEMKQENEELVTNLTELKEEIFLIEDENEANISQLGTELKEEIFVIEEENEANSSQMGLVQAHFQEMKQENEELVTNLTELKEEIFLIEDENEANISQLGTELKEEIFVIEEENEANSSQMGLVQAHFQEMKQENEELVTNLTELKEEIFLIEDENEANISQLGTELKEEIFVIEEENEANSSQMDKANEAKQAKWDTKETQTDADDLYDSEDDDPVDLNPSRHHTSYVPYRADIKDRWFTTRIRRSTDAEPDGNDNLADIEMYNVSMGVYSSEMIVRDKLADMHDSFGKKVFYHATDAGSVKNILENGIDLKKAKRPLDFSSGRGFYVTESYQRSVQWSGRVAGWMGGRGAIIAFRIDKRLLQKGTNISLQCDTDTNRKWWECIVSHFRHGKTSPDVENVLKDVEFITGPVANVRNLDPTEISVTISDDVTQMCIRKKDFAKRFGSLEKIALVIFLK